MTELSYFHSNDEAIQAGFQLVTQLFARLTRVRKSAEPTPEDGLLNARLDTWFEFVIKSNRLGVRIPFVDLVHGDGMTQHEIYMILILLAVHFETGLKETCAAIRGHAALSAPTPSMLLDLLFPSGIQKIHLYKSGQLPIILSDRRYVILRHDEAGVATEPSVYLAPLCLQKLLGLYAVPDITKVYHGKFYSMESPEETLFVFSKEQKAEILSVCRQYYLGDDRSPLYFLAYGRAGTGKHTFARHLSTQLCRPLCTPNISQILSQTGDTRHIAPIFKEIEDLKGILFIPDIHEILQASSSIKLAVLNALKSFRGLGVFTTPDNRDIDPALMALVLKTIAFSGMQQSERVTLWQHLLQNVPNALLPTEVEQIAVKYMFSGAQIMHAFMVTKLLMGTTGQTTVRRSLVEKACQFVLQKAFDGLTVSTHSEATRLERLVLPEKQLQTFQDILSAARNRDKVMIDWGFGRQLATGSGLCLLFDGPPGTGKTFAAEVLANALGRPLERVHMPNLVSKWIGETGENLAKLFAAATANHAILLLDEADALLSKRVSGGEKSSDRYANMEINILLQEIERFNGITILTTNLEKSLDEALERRVQYRITFVRPEAEDREKLWRTLMSPSAPIEGDIDYAKLAKAFELAGGHIKNAILNAAYRACSENRPIREQDLRDAARAECAKQGRLVQS